MTKAEAIRVMQEHVDELQQWLDYTASSAANIKRAETRIDAMVFAIEEMHRLEELEK